MNTKGMRLEIKPWLYQVLVEQQEILRNRSGRKTSLVDILLGFCHKGIKAHKAQKSVRNLAPNNKKMRNKPVNQSDNQSFVQDEAHLTQDSAPNLAQNEINQLIQVQLKILEYKEKALNKREKRLNEREMQLAYREKVLNQEKVKNFAQKEALLAQKTELLNNHVDHSFNKYSLGKLNDELQSKDLIIEKLEDKLQRQERKIDELISKIEKLNDRTDKKGISLIERIMPFLTPLLSIAGYFLLNNKIKDIKEIEPMQEKIMELIKKLDEEGDVKGEIG